MGAFVIRMRGEQRSARIVVPNFVANEGMERLLGQMFPPYQAAFTFKLGVSGPGTMGPDSRPQLSGGGAGMDRLLTWADVTDWEANEGGGYTDEMRASFGYERKPVTFVASRRGGAGYFVCTEQAFPNQHAWTVEDEADWDDPDTEHIIEQAPPEWRFRNLPEEPVVMFPWQAPRKLGEDLGTDPETKHLAYMKAWQPSGSLDWLYDLRKMGGFPIACAWLGDETHEELVAASIFAAPVNLWPGCALYVRYAGRLHSVNGRVTTAFLERFAKYAFQHAGGRYSSIYVRPALAAAPAGTRSRTYAEYEPFFIDDAAAVALSSWTYVPYSAGPNWPYIKSAPVSWTNETAEPEEDIGPFGHLVVYGIAGGVEELMWVTPIDPPVTLAPDEELSVTDGVQFQLDGV